MPIIKLQNLISRILVPPIQKQPFADVLQNRCFQCYVIITGKYLCWSLFLINFIKKKLHHRCFPVNIATFLRKVFFIEQCQWLFLAFTTTFRNYHWEGVSVIFFTLTHPSKQLREAAVRRCFSKNLFLKIFPNFTGNNCLGVSF